jgi:hypothetical protein
MDWINNITNKLNKQNGMCELSIHNGKVILMDSSKVYDKKVGKMLKTNDNKYVSKKVINNKKNKLYWRHLYSYLNEECIELINQMIYQYKMKSEVLGIENIIYFNRNYELEEIVSEVYDCGVSYRQLGRGWNWNNPNDRIEWNRRQLLQKKEDWIDIDIKKEDIFETDNRDKKIDFWKNKHIRFNERIRDTNKQSKSLQKSFKSKYDIKWFSMSRYCNGLMNNGEICGCESSEKKMIDRDYFNNQINPITFGEDSCNYTNLRYMRNKDRNRKKIELSLCKRHYNKYDKMNKKQLDKEVEKIYNKMGYGLQNGYLCKVC